MGEVRRAAITVRSLAVDDLLGAVSDPRAGGVAVFAGVVRDHDGGRPVTTLAYSAHPQAADAMSRVAADVATAPEVIAVAAEHRVGDLAIGDLAVVVAVSTAHRGDAFDACRRLIDDIKTSVPIWKHQRFADGTDEWVGVPNG